MRIYPETTVPFLSFISLLKVFSTKRNFRGNLGSLYIYQVWIPINSQVLFPLLSLIKSAWVVTYGYFQCLCICCALIRGMWLSSLLAKVFTLRRNRASAIWVLLLIPVNNRSEQMGLWLPFQFFHYYFLEHHIFILWCSCKIRIAEHPA